MAHVGQALPSLVCARPMFSKLAGMWPECSKFRPDIGAESGRLRSKMGRDLFWANRWRIFARVLQRSAAHVSLLHISPHASNSNVWVCCSALENLEAVERRGARSAVQWPDLVRHACARSPGLLPWPCDKWRRRPSFLGEHPVHEVGPTPEAAQPSPPGIIAFATSGGGPNLAEFRREPH